MVSLNLVGFSHRKLLRLIVTVNHLFTEPVKSLCAPETSGRSTPYSGGILLAQTRTQERECIRSEPDGTAADSHQPLMAPLEAAKHSSVLQFTRRGGS